MEIGGLEMGSIGDGLEMGLRIGLEMGSIGNRSVGDGIGDGIDWRWIGNGLEIGLEIGLEMGFETAPPPKSVLFSRVFYSFSIRTMQVEMFH